MIPRFLRARGGLPHQPGPPLDECSGLVQRAVDQLCGTLYLYVVHLRVRFWNVLALLAQPFEVKRNGFGDQPAHLFLRLANRDAARQVWDVRAVALLPLLDDNGVSLGFTP